MDTFSVSVTPWAKRYLNFSITPKNETVFSSLHGTLGNGSEHTSEAVVGCVCGYVTLLRVVQWPAMIFNHAHGSEEIEHVYLTNIFTYILLCWLCAL